MITYNHEHFIQEAIEGILMQKCDFDIELIIADDCSPDNTQSVVESFKAHPKYNWIKYIRHQTNKGMMSNFIWALSQTKAKYIALCEGDDYWTDPHKLQKQVDFLEENPEYGLVYGKAKLFDQLKGTFTGVRGDIKSEEYNEILLGKVNMPTATVMLRKSLLDICLNELKFLIDESLFYDYPLFMWFSKNSKVHFFDEIFSVYRVLPLSACHQPDKEKNLSFYFKGYAVQLYFLLNYPEKIKGKELLFFNKMLEETRHMMNVKYWIGADKKGESRNYRIGKFVMSPFSLLKKWYNRLKKNSQAHT
jgi:glycosyltransferase involved in cell wall biosynthesis